MMILWITRKNRKQSPPNDAAGEAFRQHNEAMEKFRLAHPSLNIVNARDVVLANGDLLAPVQSVELDVRSQN